MSTAKIIFMGTLGVYAHAVLQHLLKQNLKIVSVVLPGAEPFRIPIETTMRIPVLQQPPHDTIELLALKHNIPLNYVHALDSAQSLAKLARYEADFILIACFPHILPESWRALPKVACLNLHPSLLPAYRGPTPLFWQLKKGEPQLGVTLHLVSQNIDAGNIILQEQVQLREGLRGRAIDAALGELGAGLFVEALRLYQKRAVVPKIQDTAQASYYSIPGVKDFELSTAWSARHAFNFMRGTDEWQQPYRISISNNSIGNNINNEDVYLINAVAFSPGRRLGEAYRIQDGMITIQFAQGLLQAELRRF